MIKALEDLAIRGPANLDTFIKAKVLLDGLYELNESVHPTAGERRNGIVREKIMDAGNWFAMLCGIGEGEHEPNDQDRARQFVLQALTVINSKTRDEGRSFKAWHEEGPER